MTILELREKRTQAWEAAKAFAQSHRTEKGTLSPEDDAVYVKMEQEITDLGKEIARLERQEALDLELGKPINNPIISKPDTVTKDKTGRKSAEYNDSFWNLIRTKIPAHAVVNALQVGQDSEGGYLVPDEFEHQIVDALKEENVFRQLAHIIQTDNGERKIPVVATHGSASWVDEEGLIPESDDAFSQISIGSYKLGTMINVSEELINDSVFDIANYITTEFARRVGAREEEEFFNGNGVGKPTGILNDTGGAEIGVTTELGFSADDIIELYHSLRTPYRKNAIFVMNDSTAKVIRKLKDDTGNYLWQRALTSGQPDTLLGRPIVYSTFMPEIATGAKVIAFGDFSYYWIADRQGRILKRLNEIYATTGQVGFLATQRVDGKLILPEAIKVLKVGAV